MEPTITENGRINGSRITVHDVYYYLKRGRPHTEIALILGLFPDDVLAAIGYIQQHKAEVEEVYREVEERNARGNPPEIQAKLEASHAKLMAWVEERRMGRTLERNGEGNPGGR
jgi:uncharacterized protein (DUF433 family)